MGANEADREKGVLSFEMEDQADLAKSGITGAGFGVIYAMYENGENVGNDNAVFFRNLVSTQTSAAYQQFSNGKYEWNTQTLNTILNDVAAIGATTGAQAVTMDAVNQMADTVAARTSILTQRAQGVNVWVDVNGGRFEGKKVMDGAGYSSDIYAGTLGADYQFANGAVLGAALTIGTADTDSKGTTAKTSMDSDLVGFSVYGSKTFADIWNVAGDIGYLQASNDVTESGYGFGDFSEDVNAFTLGVRGEVLTKAGSVNIVPHLGLRYTRLSTDGFTAGFNTEIDDQNIFQMPVGVTVSADFETSGWTIAPKFDLSVVPTFGDKDADLKLGITGVSASDDLSVRVIDSNPVQATLGVSATNGAWGFGLNYKLGVGSDDRMNNSFNANVRYAF
jgi:outer membrane autotransporter protein